VDLLFWRRTLQGERSPWVASVVHGKVAWWELSEEVACETKDMFGKLLVCQVVAG
jgi:hypothetical protein